jgi:hypothetical protein
VLLVVIALLTLFAAVGISFVFYAEGEAEASRVFREEGTKTLADVDSELLGAYFLTKLIYDEKDDLSGVYSAMRGHSLLRSMYGMFSTNTFPYNGYGRLHTGPGTPAKPAAGQFYNNPYNIDDYYLINYTYYPTDGFLRDPERFGAFQVDPKTGQRLKWIPARTDPTALNTRGEYVGMNANYTYPDLNNMFLAAVNADGQVLVPSFYRPWTGIGPLNPTNPMWSSTVAPPAWAKYATLRPLPFYNPGFPPPEVGGDVRNVPGSGDNDSIWIDIGYPVITAPDGRKFKPLFAPLIMDLDGKLNVNVHGNIRGKNQVHVSNQGWGPSEVNLEFLPYLMNNAKATAEIKNLFLGVQGLSGQTRLYGRYGPDKIPTLNATTNQVTFGGWTAPHHYAQVDVDGMNSATGAPSLPLLLPGWPAVGGLPAGPPAYTTFPSFGLGYENYSAAERKDHPLLYNSINPIRLIIPPSGKYQMTKFNRAFAVSNMERLLRYDDTGREALTSELERLCPINFGNIRVRRLVTTTSYDPDHPGFTPWIFDPTKLTSGTLIAPGTRYELIADVGNPNTGKQPQGAPVPIFDLSILQSLTPGIPPPGSQWGAGGRAAPVVQTITNFDGFPGFSFTIDTRTRLDLSRTLPAYPNPRSATVSTGGRVDFNKAGAQAAFDAAQNARIQLALEIYYRLIRATGAYDPFIYDVKNYKVPPTPGELNALRYLAQLAANIVDFIDTDDYSTPVHWGVFGSPDFVSYLALQLLAQKLPPEAGWVFGTELPRVLLNEAYVEYVDDGVVAVGTPVKTFKVNVWVELHNPLSADATLPDQEPTSGSTSVGRLQLKNFPDPIYKVLITKRNPLIRRLDNSLGSPDNNLSTVNSFLSTSANSLVVLPSNRAYSAPTNQGTTAGGNQGFYLLGPPDSFPSNTVKAPELVPTPTLQSPGMTYKHVVATDGNVPPGPTVMLQRLVNTLLPEQKDPTKPYYNPYITVDYMDLPNTAVNLAATVDALGKKTTPLAVQLRASFGRSQPHAGINLNTQLLKQIPATKAGVSLLTNQPQNTFFAHNVGTTAISRPNFGFTAGPTAKSVVPPKAPTTYPAFDWLIHLDRQLINPMELLHVSAYRPFELTQQFVTAAGKYQHMALWFDESRRIYRVFEVLESHNRAQGVTGVGARIPGKVNINTIWDPEIFLGLCDPPIEAKGPGPVYFDDQDLYTAGDSKTNPATIYWQMMKLRTPGLLNSSGLGLNDRPFRGMATEYSAASVNDLQHQTRGSGIEDTFLRNGLSGTRLFQSPPGEDTEPTTVNPYPQNQLLIKLYSNVTTRSNVFAVWVTVGFFEVTDDTVRPVKLGAELGRDQNRHIRHRFFAIVDRSNLGPFSTTSKVAVTDLGEQTIAVGAISGTSNGIPWSIDVGSQLVASPGTASEIETITVTGVTPATVGPPAMPATITATFTRTHHLGFTLSGYGIPAPVAQLNVHNNATLIPHYSVID